MTTITTDRLPLPELARLCRDETHRFRQNQPSDSRYCYELWRRALVARDQAAWEWVYVQYENLIITYIKRHPSFARCYEEPATLVPVILGKLWSAVTPERFSQFPTLASLLKFIQVCTYHLVLDHCTAHEPELTALQTAQPLAAPPLAKTLDVHAFWSCVEQQARDERERLVIRERLRRERKPEEIMKAYPDTFPTKGILYRVTENLRARLIRDASGELKPCLETSMEAMPEMR